MLCAGVRACGRAGVRACGQRQLHLLTTVYAKDFFVDHCRQRETIKHFRAVPKGCHQHVEHASTRKRYTINHGTVADCCHKRTGVALPPPTPSEGTAQPHRGYLGRSAGVHFHVLPDRDRAVFTQALVVKTVHLCNLPALVVAADQRNPARVSHFQRQP